MPDATTTPSPGRRLAAILAADVVGYSRLMEADPAGTVARIRALRADLIDPRIAQHRGEVLKRTGDGALVEFTSVEDAVQAAVAIQRAMADANRDVPEDQRVEFRVGIEIGDVIYEEDDFHGTGVIVASRIEGLADPGGICVTQSVFNRVRNLVDAGFEGLGPRDLKNIAHPVTVYRVLTGPGDAGKVTGVAGPPGGVRPNMWLAAAAVLILLAAFGGWWVWSDRAARQEATATVASALPLADKPSIAVLPFDNLSGDPDQEYFSDGLSEDIITSLSHVFGLFVIARNSSFQYKGRSVDIRQIAEELGVQYVLEGSVQRSGDDLRVTAQLIDGASGRHIWSQRYDRKFDDLFAVHDGILKEIVAALHVNVSGGTRAFGVMTESAQAHDYVLLSETLRLKRTKNDNEMAMEYAEKAIALDPEYAMAWVQLGWAIRYTAVYGWTDDPDAAYEKAIEMAEKALSINPALGPAYRLLGDVTGRYSGDLAQQIAYYEKGVEFEPNDYRIRAQLAGAHTFVGRLDEAIQSYKAAIRLSPFAPDWVVAGYARALFMAGDSDEALAAFQTVLARDHSAAWGARAHAHLALIYAERGQEEEARREAALAGETHAQGRVERLRSWYSRLDPEILDRWTEAWRRFGMPE